MKVARRATTVPRVLKEVLSLPTAPYSEGAVVSYIEQACRSIPHVRLIADRWGNRLAHYRRRGAKAAPVVFTAHMDHPGFCAVEQSGREVVADFRGWVETPYFTDAALRFWAGRRTIRGRVRKVLQESAPNRVSGRAARPERVLVEADGPVPPGSPGMWDLPDPSLKNGKVLARACDDLAGVASMLALLQRLGAAAANAECYCLFTRAEEVGFIGAIGAARSRTIPRGLPVVAIETSKMLPHAPQGAGPILRVGDKASVFTPPLTAFCERVARSLRDRNGDFVFQRKLMDGGTCESTAYLAYGYATTGVCVALGNYHNMNEATRRIDCESIDLNDWKNMVDWFESIVLNEIGYSPQPSATREEMDARFEMAKTRLRA